MTQQEIKTIARSTAMAILKDKSTDSFLMALEIKGSSTSDVSNAVAKELQEHGILKPGWEIIGRNKIQGKYDRDVLEDAIRNGRIG